jgi:type II secretory ATPase GspE/PulE/Tfp pilus assembly ATPase PilB-like protein
MGIEPFLVSSSLECLIAQRLVRLICPKCKIALSKERTDEVFYQISAENLADLQRQLYEGKGCKECRFTGYLGRTAIYEIIEVSEPIREMVIKRASAQQIKQKAIQEGMRSLRQDGIHKVLEGLTTYSEVLRVSQEEES